MDDLQGLNERLSALENRLKSNFFQAEKRLTAIEQKEPQTETIGEERVQELEDLMLLLQIENSKIKEKFGTQEIVESPPVLEQRIAKIEEKLGQGAPENIEARIAGIESAVSSLKGEKTSGPITITSKDADVYLERMNRTKTEIENGLNKLKLLKDTVENISAERQGVLQKIQNVEIDIEKASTAFTKMKTVEEKINAQMEKVEALKEGVDAKISAGYERTETARKDVENRVFAVEEKFKTRMEKLDAVQESLQTKIGAINSRAAELEVLKPRLERLNDLASLIEEESIQRGALEKHLQDLNAKLAAMGYVAENYEDTASQVSALERKIIGTGNKMTEMETHLATISDKLVGEIRTAMDKEIYEKSQEFSSKIRDVSDSLNIEEIRKLRDETAEQHMKLNDLEGKLELAATRFFTENLEQFAMALDKKFPDFVSKKEYSRDIAEVSQKLKSVQSPDLSPLAERVMFLERRLTEIYDTIKSMSSRMPVFVE